MVWQRILSSPHDGESESLVVDDAGNLYTAVRGEQGWASTDILKLAPGGEAIWRAAVDEANGSVVAVGGGRLYVESAYDLHVLNTIDGTSAWR